jgi:hypothetical protein
MEPDIIERIQCDFGQADSDLVIRILEEFEHDGRLARCIVVAAQRSIEKFKQLVEMANLDYRDVNVAGEDDRSGSQVRDLAASFLIDSPKHFWVSGIAQRMHRRDCRLVEIESQTAPWRGMDCSKYEGVGRFVGPIGELTVELRNHAWTLHDRQRDLSFYGLDRTFENQSGFCDAVSSYVLMHSAVSPKKSEA